MSCPLYGPEARPLRRSHTRDTVPGRYQDLYTEVVRMDQQQDPASQVYPHGRGYGHDYMRGGEVLGGYGYSERDEYSKSRGELETGGPEDRNPDDRKPPSANTA
jgi:hypothetical protein